MKTSDNVLKSSEFVFGSITQDALVSDTIKLIAITEMGALLVLEAGKLVGISIEGDHVRNVNLTGRSFTETQVRELIARNVIYTPAEQVFEKCLALTQEKLIRHVPVIADGHLIGIISMGDLAREVISDQEDLVQFAPW